MTIFITCKRPPENGASCYIALIPQLIPKRQKRFKEVDKRTPVMYARGMSVRDMRAMLQKFYETEALVDLLEHPRGRLL